MKNNLNSVAGAAITTDVPLLRSRDEEEGGSGSGRNHGRSREGRPKQPWKGEFVKSVVYAGLDAIVTCFSLISSISAGHLSSGIYAFVCVCFALIFQLMWNCVSGRAGAGFCKSGGGWDLDGVRRFCVEQHGEGRGGQGEGCDGVGRHLRRPVATGRITSPVSSPWHGRRRCHRGGEYICKVQGQTGGGEDGGGERDGAAGRSREAMEKRRRNVGGVPCVWECASAVIHCVDSFHSQRQGEVRGGVRDVGAGPGASGDSQSKDRRSELRVVGGGYPLQWCGCCRRCLCHWLDA